jgi:hypothetical protein
LISILHTADWQIGRVFAQFEPDDAAALFEARFAVVERLAGSLHCRRTFRSFKIRPTRYGATMCHGADGAASDGECQLSAKQTLLNET